MKFILKKREENAVIQFGILFFWAVFWLFNVLDKIIPGKTFLWVGKDRYTQLLNYFATIGIQNEIFAQVTLFFITLLETIAATFLIIALVYFVAGKRRFARGVLFWGFFVSLSIFSMFTIGDQVFGDRVELLEHSLYWISIIISWFVYTSSEN